MAKNDAATEITQIGSETIKVHIVGTTPLIMHRFSEKAKKKMLDNMQGRKTPKERKDPEAEFKAAAYRMSNNGDGAEYGFPAVAFKSAIVSAARFYGKNEVTMTGLRQFVFVYGDAGDDGMMLVPILGAEDAEGDWPRMREDVVRVNRGGSDLRYRPEFSPWHAYLTVTYVTSALTRGSVLSLIDAAGLGVGVGEWRPEKSGDFGQFRVDSDQDVEVIKGGAKKS